MIPEHRLASRPDAFGSNLTRPPSADRIRAGFTQYDPYLLRTNGAESDAVSRIRAGFTQYDPYLLRTNGAKSDAVSRIRAGFTQYDPYLLGQTELNRMQ